LTAIRGTESLTRSALTVFLTVVVLCLEPWAASWSVDAPARLASELRALYARRAPAWERWERRRSRIVLADGSRAYRDEAYRDDPSFVDAARILLASGEGDDAPLGAWLLGTLPATREGAATPALVEALRHPDRRAAFEAALALGAVGGAGSLGPLQAVTRGGPGDELREAASWAARRVATRNDLPSRDADPPAPRLPPGFFRGVSWWVSEARPDEGATSFAQLASLGVNWVSIHTWDPIQRGLHDPELAPPARPSIPDLGAIVGRAHAAGLRVLYKPHLEMRSWEEPTPEDLLILRGHDSAARRRTITRLRSRARALTGRHNEIAMLSEEDWRLWFRGYEAYILAHARQAREAGADMFCVGRELDGTAIRRERDWRRVIRRVRAEFPGKLVYSANFDTYGGISFWDALDFIGVSAYFGLSDAEHPSDADLARGWERALGPLRDLSLREGRPVLFTEVGYPAVARAARAPWRENEGPADVWLQSRLASAALDAMARRPWIQGAFFWLWERSTRPPFRDASFALEAKPAAFALAAWYRGPTAPTGPTP
jgi:hypothetical protein